MCGRFVTPTEADIERHWNLRAPLHYFRSFNAAPSQPLWIIRNGADGQRELKQYACGFQPTWAGRSWINARLESVFSSKVFASATRKRRCLVPAVGWYEWQARSGGKQPYVFHLPEFRPFAFAGIWTARQTETGWSHNFAIITRLAASDDIAAVHDRMPALVHPARYDDWLSAGTEDPRRILAEPFGSVAFYPVSTYVNKPAHNDKRCIEPGS